MIIKHFIKTAVGGLILLTSYQAFSAATDLNVKSINVPAFNLITDTLNGMNLINGKRNDFVMQQICGLVRGTKSQNDVNAILARNNIDINSIPKEGALVSLLVNGNKPDQTYSCASYQATSLFQPIDNSSLYDSKKNKKGKVETTLNPERFAQDVKEKMAVAQATAQLYAVIASNLPTDSNLSWADYQKSVVETVYHFSPEYLSLIERLSQSDKASYSLGEITKSTLNVADSEGHVLQMAAGGVALSSRGVMWFGNGKILGKEYFVPVKIINSLEEKKTETVKKSAPVKNK